MNMVRTDKAGTARAAALQALRFYAGPELLPLLHEEALGELHPVAWGRAMELLEPLADQNSIPILCQLLQRQENLTNEGVIRIAHAMVRIGDPKAVTCLEVLERATISKAVSAEARAAINLLAVPVAKRFETVTAWDVLEIYVTDPAQPEPEPFQLGVFLDSNGMAVWVSTPAE